MRPARGGCAQLLGEPRDAQPCLPPGLGSILLPQTPTGDRAPLISPCREGSHQQTFEYSWWEPFVAEDAELRLEGRALLILLRIPEVPPCLAPQTPRAPSLGTTIHPRGSKSGREGAAEPSRVLVSTSSGG